MFIVDEESGVTVEDKIKFTLVSDTSTELEGIVTYDFDRNAIVTIGKSTYPFEGQIKSYRLLEPGPFHNAFEPKVEYSYGDFVTTTSETTDLYSTPKIEINEDTPFTYYFGESACNVFERWVKRLNELAATVKGSIGGNNDKG